MSLKSILLSAVAILCLSSSSWAYQRVVLLSPAAADIFLQLGLKGKIVGVTRHIKGFPDAVKVGSHIKPNVEIIASLHPDLIVYSTSKHLPQALKIKVKARYYHYDPKTIAQLFEEIMRIAQMLNVYPRGQKLVAQLKNKLAAVKKLSSHPRVVYEVMYIPYMLAGQKNIVSDVIAQAGGINLIQAPKKFVKYSLEKVVQLQPDIYIYQIGPMNKKPLPPQERLEFKTLKAKFLKVNELAYARANTHIIDAVLQLNKIFYRWTQHPSQK